MIKSKVLKRIITFLLIVSFIFVTADFSAAAPVDYFCEMISENQSAKLSNTNSYSYSYQYPHILKKLDVLGDHQFLRISGETIQRFIKYSNDSQGLIYIPVGVIYPLSNILYSQNYYNIISSGKSRLSVLALSLGGHSPPLTRI